MKPNLLIIAMLTTLAFTSCKETPKEKNKEAVIETNVETTSEKNSEEILTSTATDKEGNELKMSFNNTKNTATVKYNGKTIELVGQVVASGILYKNETYKLTGKGHNIQLTKDGEVVFSHEDEIVKSTVKNKAGQTLDMTFNNTTNKAIIFLNGGEQIELLGQKPASGIWYKNNHYELTGKGEEIELKKDGETVFKRLDR
ncbi:lysozyme inhibitor [Aquimarina sp. TRL1]|uniref:MliC family protein n=1 Tax=Aquimarina sp. (strain TRL1) TaxID=2736252 RepID=UPI00158E5C9E|nr:MliC family protein [Aquimarina sp. TRL1]QKX05356.1 lysozyme inhibitor [Aquimarina sp. TRL1]